MNQDPLESLFKNRHGEFDLAQTPDGHQARFMERLNEHKPKKSVWYRSPVIKPIMAVAAIALVALFITGVFNAQPEEEAGLAAVSPEMAQTQEFFTIAINDQISRLKSFDSEASKELVDDTLEQLSALETEYNSLSQDLVTSGNDKRVVYALIANLQSRIDLLEQMIITIEQIELINQSQEDETDNYTI
ncbi:MAG: hypothetical protein ABJM06_08265 [Gilvibacter sp.]